MKKLFNFLFLLPLAILLILFSVANREAVQVSFDPTNAANPALGFEIPLFVIVFVCFLIGMLVGGFMVWISQGKHRRVAREKAHEANRLKRQKDEVEAKHGEGKQEIAPGLPLVTQR